MPSGLTAEIYRIPDTEVKPLNSGKDMEKTTIQERSNEPVDPQTEKWTRAVEARFWENKENDNKLKEDLALRLEEEIKHQADINQQQRAEIKKLKEEKGWDFVNNYNRGEEGKFISWSDTVDSPDHIEIWNTTVW